MSLQFYLQDTTALLGDQAYLFTSQTQLTRWINEARRHLAKRTGCIERLITGQSAYGSAAQPGYMIPGGIQPGALPGPIPATGNPQIAFNAAQTGNMTTLIGVERYPYKGFFNPVLKDTYAGVKGVIDCLELSINWGGNFRPSLMWLPWDDLQAYCRSYANQTTAYPAVWSVFNDGEDGEVWIFPVPSEAGEMEARVICIPEDIYSDDDVDAIPEGYRDAIKFKAAALAFMAQMRYQEAQGMENVFAQTVGIDTTAVDRGKVPNFYFRSI